MLSLIFRKILKREKNEKKMCWNRRESVLGRERERVKFSHLSLFLAFAPKGMVGLVTIWNL